MVSYLALWLTSALARQRIKERQIHDFGDIFMTNIEQTHDR